MKFELENEEYIRLGDLLKAAGVLQTGGEAKQVIQAGEVKVDGAVRTEGGAKIRAGQIVTYAGKEIQVEAKA